MLPNPQQRGFHATLVSALSSLVSDETVRGRLAEVSFRELRSGVVLAEDVYSVHGTLILARGHTIRGNVLDRLRALQPSLGGRQTFRVRLPD